MSEPVVIVDTSRIREGRLEEVKTAMSELARFVEANEPRAVAYAVYLDERESSVTVLQVHPDASSAEYHMDVAASEFPKFAGWLELRGIDVYGSPSDELLARLSRKAHMLGGGNLVVHPAHAAFFRFGEVPSATTLA